MKKEEKIQWLLEPLIQDYGKQAIQKALNDITEVSEIEQSDGETIEVDEVVERAFVKFFGDPELAWHISANDCKVFAKQLLQQKQTITLRELDSLSHSPYRKKVRILKDLGINVVNEW